ncbi:hypothetical protein EYF80_052768 [Liparis tanakae]|uniref:Uncharacterized protein n=1 Tax=Liparis tanakae TaxID=230148 RepID=A0A4Z2F9S2_9TELE|nr:hypothetical protein EYF80_052768 [Liparis tanakae]
MTESSANKLLNGDACHRTSNDKKSGKNGFVKNHCLFQQPQKYRRPRERVRPDRQRLPAAGTRCCVQGRARGGSLNEDRPVKASRVGCPSSRVCIAAR